MAIHSPQVMRVEVGTRAALLAGCGEVAGECAEPLADFGF